MAISATMPPPQDQRRKKVRQLAGILQRLQDSLTKIDSGALAQTLHEVDKALHHGKANNATNPVTAFILAGLVREDAGAALSAVIVAIKKAANNLDEPSYDLILEVIWRLERTFSEFRLDFDAKDNGFAAQCFRIIYEHANPGETKDRPKYLLKKAIEDPRSLASRIKAGR